MLLLTSCIMSHRLYLYQATLAATSDDARIAVLKVGDAAHRTLRTTGIDLCNLSRGALLFIFLSSTEVGKVGSTAY